jgi:phosphoribosyl 1,2-cyclic phosphate phosphodiesterase
MAGWRFTILGCGSSGGVPRLGNDWGDCDPGNPKNRRRRCSLLVERTAARGTTRVLIDAAPDLREQLLDAHVGTLDGVAFTHGHADHTHGIDDLRQVVFNRRHRLPVWADGPTQTDLISRFGYAFVQPPESPYPPILDLHSITHHPFEVDGAGGTVTLIPFIVDHGSIEALGLRIGPLTYIPDVLTLPDAAWPHITGVPCLVIDALRRKPHPTHAHLALTLDWIARARPDRAVLTNMHLDMDYATLVAELPPGIEPAYDGMVLTFED